MTASESLRDPVILSPEGPLTIGGPAEAYERRVEAVFQEGHRHLITDLSKVPHLDSMGVRALVRGYTTARRLGGSFKLVAPAPRVRKLLGIARLDTVFQIYDSLDAARAGEPPARS